MKHILTLFSVHNHPAFLGALNMGTPEIVLLLVVVVPAWPCWWGWRTKKPLSRSEFVTATIWLFMLNLIWAAMMGASGKNVGALAIGIIGWLATNVFWLKYLGRRLRDAGFPLWATLLSGAFAWCGLPFLAACLWPTMACADAEKKLRSS
ncbi:MAG TPA: hypothetical protein VIM69_01430 [Opitutaceae bacterium]